MQENEFITQCARIHGFRCENFNTFKPSDQFTNETKTIFVTWKRGEIR
jgi:hypothetical protein